MMLLFWMDLYQYTGRTHFRDSKIGKVSESKEITLKMTCCKIYLSNKLKHL